MTDGFSVSVDNEQGPPMGWGQQYSAMAYQVVNETGTQSLRVAMPVDGINVKTWIEQVGRCFELEQISYDRETQMMTATFRPGNGLALIAQPNADKEQP